MASSSSRRNQRLFTAEEVLEQSFQDDFGQGDSDGGDIDLGEDDNEKVPSSDSEWEYEEENLPPSQTLDFNLLSWVATMSSIITEEVEEIIQVNDLNPSLAEYSSMVNNFEISPLVSPTTIDDITTKDFEATFLNIDTDTHNIFENKPIFHIFSWDIFSKF